MTRLRDDYEHSRYRKFKRWYDGEVNLLEDVMDVTLPDGKQEGQKESRSAGPSGSPALEARRKASEAVYGPEVWPQRETVDYAQWRRHAQEALEARIHPDGYFGAGGRPGNGPAETAARGLRRFRRFYQVMSVILCMMIIAVFLWTTIHLPPFGGADNPANNEVPARYIESGLAETGAINFVTGMILDYRAFDTFGESCVLFIASCCVLVLLRIDASNGTSRARSRGPQEDDRLFEPKNDVILQRAAFILVPLILVFGVYIVLNGHLSPGGGFSGGAVLGSGLILYLNAFGFAKTERFFTEKVYRRVTLCALTFYCLAKSYSFFTGANHLESGIPLGTPGAILSSGLILPLNICVGLVVMCTMYAFYTLFRKGGM